MRALKTALVLGRVSNLPTVWTNVLAGLVLSGAPVAARPFLGLAIALSLFYVGGMYLNDAFDRQYDAAAYPRRPIPSGAVSARAVFLGGFAFLLSGELILVFLGRQESALTGHRAAVVGLLLIAAIVLYDLRHKETAWGPVIMSLCRALVYLVAASVITAAVSAPLWIGMALLAAYVIGLSYIAKQETLSKVQNLWPLLFLLAPLGYGAARIRSLPSLLTGIGFLIWLGYAGWLLRSRSRHDIRQGVMTLIAGIAWVDAFLISLTEHSLLALGAVGGALLTRLAHRVVPGT